MKYEIQGTPFPVVICELEKGEKMVSDSGAMVWMDPCMTMETTSGGIGKAFGRMFSGETILTAGALNGVTKNFGLLMDVLSGFHTVKPISDEDSTETKPSEVSSLPTLPLRISSRTSELNCKIGRAHV